MDMQINEVAFKVGDLVWDRRNQTSYRITRLSGSVAYGNDKGKEIASHVSMLMPYSEYAENPEAGYPKSRGRPRTNFDPPVSLADYQAIYYRLFHRELKELVRQLLKDNRPKVVELKTRCREEAKKIAMKRNW